MTATPFVDRTGDDDTTWQAELARIEAAPTAPESARDRLIQAMWKANYEVEETGPYAYFAALADAAIAVMKPARVTP